MSARMGMVLSKTTDTEHISKPYTNKNMPYTNSFSGTKFFISPQDIIPVIYSDYPLEVLL
jgi:hypothetical protein